MGGTGHHCLRAAVPIDDGWVHLIGRVQRVERGDDFRTYVALALVEELNHQEIERWREWVDEQRPSNDANAL
jgi:hypothetical protein